MLEIAGSLVRWRFGRTATSSSMRGVRVCALYLWARSLCGLPYQALATCAEGGDPNDRSVWLALDVVFGPTHTKRW